MADAPPVLPADAPVVDAPPAPTTGKRGRGRPPKADAAPKAPRPVGRPTNDDKLAAKLGEMYGMAAMAVMLVDADLGLRIAQHADELGQAWVKLAAEYPAVRRVLERLVTTSALGAFLAVHLRVFGPTLLDKFGGNLAGLFGGGQGGDVLARPWPQPAPEAPTP